MQSLQRIRRWWEQYRRLRELRRIERQFCKNVRCNIVAYQDVPEDPPRRCPECNWSSFHYSMSRNKAGLKITRCCCGHVVAVSQ